MHASMCLAKFPCSESGLCSQLWFLNQEWLGITGKGQHHQHVFPGAIPDPFPQISSNPSGRGSNVHQLWQTVSPSPSHLFVGERVSPCSKGVSVLVCRALADLSRGKKWTT